MPRKKTKSLQRIPNPDRFYNSVLVQRLINKAMLDGKKTAAEKRVYQAMEEAAKKLELENPLEALEGAMKNVWPEFEVKGRRVGGANYQVPFPVQGHRRTHLGLMWFIAAARGKKGMPFSKRLSTEIVDAYNNTGSAVKKKEDVHKMAEANRAFAHFARG
jgi:small subunit ribosomal protein S7